MKTKQTFYCIYDLKQNKLAVDWIGHIIITKLKKDCISTVNRWNTIARKGNFSVRKIGIKFYD